ncbi:MAG TPA: hypothetical protein DCY89_03085 [Gammaproteobacteria bacterium]|nr:hypothetical protein [Gammaproteobacteria bacterium]
MRLFLNVVSFQCVWFACTWGAGHGIGWLGPAVLLAHVGLHRFIAGVRWLTELRYALLAAVVGATGDSALQWLGLLEFAASPWGTAFAPPWMLALWIGFCTLLDHSLGWLRGRPRLTFGLGGVAGALTYWVAERLMALQVLGDPIITYGAVALLWSVALPLLAETSPRCKSARGASAPPRDINP